jgi:hypothetical protein
MRSLLEKDEEILMHILHAVVLIEEDRTVTSLAISPPILKVLPSQSPFMRQEARASVNRRKQELLAARDESAGSRQGCPWSVD